MMAEQPVYLDDEVQILEAPRAAAAGAAAGGGAPEKENAVHTPAPVQSWDFLGKAKVIDVVQDDEDEEEKLLSKYMDKWNCNLMRRKIQEYLATKEMTQTKFLETIGRVNSNSFGNFMKLKGPYTGINNGKKQTLTTS